MPKSFAWRFNPVFQREMLTRWRHPVSFVLVVAYAVVIAVGVGWQLFEAPTGQSESELGHSIWQTLTITQTLGWMALGPVLTAGALAGEREKGHLDALLLSPLTPREIVNGKMLGALSLVVLLLLVPLPAIALCFLLGGVSPLEFVASLVLSFSTALSGLSFGMMASAQSRDAGQAVGKALLRALGAQGLMLVFCCCPAASPLFAITWLLESAYNLSWHLIVFPAIHFMIMRNQLGHAVRELARPLAEPYRPAVVSSAPPVSLSDVARITAHMPSPRGSWLRFSNPVLQREAQARLSFKWSSNSGTNDMALGCATLVFAGYIVPLALVAWFDPAKCKNIWWMVSYPWLVCALVATALSTASTFTREREGGHWPLLWLSPLTHGEIIGGKLGGVLFGVGYYSLWLLPFWIPCAFVLPISITASTLLSGLSAIWLAANIGLLFSALCRKTGTALNWTIISLLAWWLFYPPWNDWQSASRTAAQSASFGHAFVLLLGGELLYLLTHRILHRAPYEN